MWYCPEEGSSNPGLGSIVHCTLKVRVNHESNEISVSTITVGSTNLPNWPIGEAVRLWKKQEGRAHKAIGNEDPMQRVNYLIHCAWKQRWKEDHYYYYIRGFKQSLQRHCKRPKYRRQFIRERGSNARGVYPT